MDITLPSGAVFDFGDLPGDQIAEQLTTLRGSNPELFQEPAAQPEGAPDPATTPFAELQAYYNRRSGSSELSPEVTNKGEVKDFAAQFFVGRGDDDEERQRRLTEIFGPGSVIRLGADDFALDSDKIDPAIRKKYGLEETGTTRFNRPGLSWQDVYSFLGSETVPMVSALGAGVAATGLATLPGVGLVFLAGAAGKAVDEFIIEDIFEGLQMESTGEVLKSVLIQGLIEAGGEVVGRGVGKAISAFGRGRGPAVDSVRASEIKENYISQGMSPKKAGRLAKKAAREETSAAYRQMIEQGANIPAVTLTGKNLLGRAQAIWESIFPQEASVGRNVDFIKSIKERLARGEMTKDAASNEINTVAESIVAKLSASMADPDKAVIQANKELKTVLEAEFNLLNDVLKESNSGFTGLATVWQDGLDLATKMFTMRSNQLYRNADNLLEGETIDLGPLKTLLKDLQDKRLSGGDALKSGIFKIIEETPSLEISQIPALRAALRASEQHPDLLGTPAGRNVKTLIDSVNFSVTKKTEDLTAALLKARQQKKSAAGIAALREGLELLNNANKHYADGAEIINSGLIQQINTQITNKNMIDFKSIVDQAVQPGKPATLRTLLDVITPSPKEVNVIIDTAKANPGVFEAMSRLLAEGGEGAITAVNKKLEDLGLSPQALKAAGFQVEDAARGRPANPVLSIPETFSRLPVNDPTRIRLQNDFSDTLDMYARMARAGSAPAAYRQGFQNLMAREWLDNAVTLNTMDDGVNYPALAASFDSLKPPLQKELFGNQVTEFRKVMNDFKLLGRTGTDQLNGFSGSIANADANTIVKTFKELVQQSEVEAQDAFLSAMKGGTPDTDKLVTNLLLNPKNYETLKNRLGVGVLDEVNGVKDLMMSRIILSGFPNGKVTDDLVSKGDWGRAWLKSIEDLNEKGALDTVLGKDTIDGLKKVANSGLTISDSVMKGKTGLAAAAYSAAFLAMMWAAPVVTLVGAGGILAASRALRTKPILRYLSSPRLRAYEAKRAIEGGADLSTWEAKKRVVDPLTGDVTIGAPGSRNFAAEKAREAAARAIRLIISEVAYYGSQRGADAVSREIVDPIRQRSQEPLASARPVVQDIQQQIPNAAAAAQQMSPLRLIEQNKLLGIAPGQ